jgi:SAM-dependent methyltransferase
LEKEAFDIIFSLEQHHWWFIARRCIILRLMQKFLQNNMTVAELGVGCGSNIQEFSKYYNIIGIDSSEDSIKYCGLKGIKIKKAILPSTGELPHNHFDCILLLDVLEHIENDQLAIENISKLLKEDGFLFVTVPAYQWLFNNYDKFSCHFRRYTAKQLHHILINSGFRKIIISYYNFFLFPFAVILRLCKKFLNQTDKKELDMPSTFVNKLFQMIFQMERFILPYISLPFGLSIIAIYKKSNVHVSFLSKK